MSGWGAAWDGKVPASAFLGEKEEGPHINELEVTAAPYALKSFLPFAHRSHLLLITCSKVTEHVLRNLTIRSPSLLKNLLQLYNICGHNVTSLLT